MDFDIPIPILHLTLILTKNLVDCGMNPTRLPGKPRLRSPGFPPSKRTRPSASFCLQWVFWCTNIAYSTCTKWNRFWQAHFVRRSNLFAALLMHHLELCAPPQNKGRKTKWSCQICLVPTEQVLGRYIDKLVTIVGAHLCSVDSKWPFLSCDHLPRTQESKVVLPHPLGPKRA